MRFAIRDDDTNFYTTPAELEACYKEIWNDFPPTLSLISKVKGNWLYWVHQIYKDKQNTDWTAWEKDDTIYPIEQNSELISFLKQEITKGRLDISYHAKHHRNEDEMLPEERSNNYVRGAEYFTNQDRTQEIKNEITHLEQLLGRKISVFTPPQNLLSMQGYQSVLSAGLNLCGGGIPFYKKEKNLKGLYNIFKQLSFKLLNRESDYPRVLKFNTHNEIAYHYPLQPTTRLDSLKYDFDMVRKYNGDFVLSTHYVEFDYPMVYDEKMKMKRVLMDFLDYVSKFKVEKMSLSEMLA
ncbi:MAG: hypothetical protein H6551_08010 [Chitinophagales bacterium]|nr:hypothetical protein [Chitinophagaceae bacterium]MCB9065066.1 hypothetical protein [Chitinophagales bacterium]